MSDSREQEEAAIAADIEAVVSRIQAFEGRVASGWLLVLDMRSMDADGSMDGVSVWHPKNGLPMTQVIGTLRMAQLSFESHLGHSD